MYTDTRTHNTHKNTHSSQGYDFSQNAGPSVMPILASSSPDAINLETKETGPVLSVGSKYVTFYIVCCCTHRLYRLL